MAWFFIEPPINLKVKKTNGTQISIIAANLGPFANPSTKPEKQVPHAYTSYPSFSPAPSWRWKKFSEIFEGRASICCFSKYAVSCFIKAKRYFDFKLNAIFSACYCMMV